MATLPTNELGLSSNLSGVAITGTEPVLELIASAADASYAHSGTNNASGTFTAEFDLDNMPNDFGNMDTLSVQLRYLRAAGTLVNTWNSLDAQIIDSSNEALSNTVTVASNITTTTATNSSVITLTGLNTTANKTTWDNAKLRISWVITRNMGGDTIEKRVTAAQLTGTYTAALPAIVGTLASTETGADTFAASGTVTDSPITGELAIIESGVDTLDSDGKILIKGNLSAIEVGNDFFTLDGNVLIQGNLAFAEIELDTFEATGQLASVIVGTLAATENVDSFVANGNIIITGNLSAIEVGNDSFIGGSSGNILGNFSATEDLDIFTSSGFIFFEYPDPSIVVKGKHYGPNG